MQITLRQVEIFLAVVDHGNTTQAAKAINLSQSAVSMALNELESQLDGPLFDRVGRGLKLNDRGRLLYPKANELMSRVDEIATLFETHKGDLVGQLVVAASSTIGNSILPTLLAGFCNRHPKVDIKTLIGNTNEVSQAVKSCRADIGFVEGSCLDNDLEATPWKSDRLVVFAHPDHPLAKRKRISKTQLLEADWILRETGSGTREVFERALGDELVGLNVRLELGTSEAVKQSVKQNLGLGCLSSHVIADELAAGTLVELKTPELKLERSLFAVLHRQKYRTQLLDAFAAECAVSSATN